MLLRAQLDLRQGGRGLREGHTSEAPRYHCEGGDALTFRIRRSEVTSPETCPGIRDFIRPTMKYVKCHECGGDVEIWSDEDTGVCLDCGAEWVKHEEDVSCLDYCEYADQCREIIAARNPEGSERLNTV